LILESTTSWKRSLRKLNRGKVKYIYRWTDKHAYQVEFEAEDDEASFDKFLDVMDADGELLDAEMTITERFNVIEHPEEFVKYKENREGEE